MTYPQGSVFRAGTDPEWDRPARNRLVTPLLVAVWIAALPGPIMVMMASPGIGLGGALGQFLFFGGHLVSLASLLVAGVLTAIWMYRSIRFAAYRHATRQRLSAGFAAASWFIPVANLWLPAVAITDLVRSAVPIHDRANVIRRTAWWWALWLGSWFAPSVASLLLLLDLAGAPASTDTRVMVSLSFTLLAGLLRVVAAVLFSGIVRRIDTGLHKLVPEHMPTQPVTALAHPTNASFPTAPEPLRAGDPISLGPFHVIGRLRTDLAGVVYLGEHGRALAAIHLFDPVLAALPEFRERLNQRLAITPRVTDPRVARVVAVDLHAAQPWVAHEYRPGPTLAATVDAHGPLPMDKVEAIGTQLSLAVHALHSINLTHGNLAPDTVVLTDAGTCLIDPGTPELPTGFGPPRTPEQAAGQPGGTWSDVFSLANVLVFAATRHTMFETGSRSVGAPAGDAGLDLSGLPARLRRPLISALSVDPAARPTAAGLAAEFARQPGPAEAPPQNVHLDHNLRLPAPPEPHDRTATGGRSRRFAVLAAVTAAIVVVMLVVGGLYLVGTSDPLKPRHRTVADLSAALDAGTGSVPTALVSETVAPRIHDPSRTTREGAFRIENAGTSGWYSVKIDRAYGPDLSKTVVVIHKRNWVLGEIFARPETPWVEQTGITHGDRLINWARPLGDLLARGDAVTIVDSASEQLDGQPATRYTLRTDHARAAFNAEQRGGPGPTWRHYKELLRAGKPETLYTLWLNERQQPIGARVETQFPDLEPTITDIRWRAWGEPIQIDPPPPEQVMQLQIPR